MVKKIKSLETDAFILPQEFPTVITEGKIYQEANLRVSIFFVPKGCRIPIHDHPNMFVISKVLSGKMNYFEYSLNDKSFQIKVPKLFVANKSVEFPTITAVKNSKIL